MIKKILYISLVTILISCQSEYQKLLKSNDYENMYEQALTYYNTEDYYKAYSLFEKLLPIYRITEKGEKINYYIARCYYEEGDYLMAAYYFNQFIVTFPDSEYCETAQYFMALCYQYNSPKPSLDQTYTYKAIDEFQRYINKYPQGQYIKESNNYIAELREKLEIKAYEKAKLYYLIEDYKAAVVVLKNCLLEYPDTKFREEILYMTFRAAYLLAKNSVEDKKEQRIESAIDEYEAYIDEYPEGQWIKDAEKMFEKINNKTI
ncbi:MAG: outer membrane protein assembly factor BamD [Bacteroidales bacterium]|jgi:outer membrane protein assembly factor BamD|nr:outer membrane protein assembly factor BamD [Bacteroidales bacterium]